MSSRNKALSIEQQKAALRKLISKDTPPNPYRQKAVEQEKQRLKEQLAQIPWYAEQAKKNPEFWDILAASYRCHDDFPD